MKPIAVCLAAVLLLAGCAAREDESRAEGLQARYAAMSGCTARVETALADEAETQRYTLDFAKDGDATRVTVLEPEALAGVSAAVDGGTLSLKYGGVVLPAGSALPGVSAMNAADVVLRAVAEGWITERNAEAFEGTDALRVCFETQWDGEALPVTVWFDGQDAPLYAEIERAGEVLAYLRFTDFAFCDTINDT